MQPILDHIAGVVRPALRKYLAAEKALTAALESKDAGAVSTARQDVMLAARINGIRGLSFSWDDL